MKNILETSLSEEDLKQAIQYAKEETLDGYYVKGWHYPVGEERLYRFLNKIKELLNTEDKTYLKPEEIKPLIENAIKSANYVFDLHKSWSKEPNNNIIEHPATYLIAANILEEYLAQKRDIVLDAPTI